MTPKFETPALRVLEMLRKEAPAMSLSKAYDFVNEYQEMRDSLATYEFIIMMLLKALGVSDQGNLRDKEIAEKLESMPDEVWAALKLAMHVHGGYACSPFTPQDWDKAALKKIGLEKKDIDSYKNSQLGMLREL
jgi:hypothetical protein